VNTADSQAAVLERHLGSSGVLRGVNVAGGEFAAPESDPTSEFSNRNPGAYNVAYHYDSAATFRFLASRGLRVVRLPFRWERIQPSLGGPLDRSEARRLRRVIARAHDAGVQDWSEANPRPWIHDPAGNVRYQAHQYFDLDHSGAYAMSYAQQDEALRSDGY